MTALCPHSASRTRNNDLKKGVSHLRGAFRLTPPAWSGTLGSNAKHDALFDIPLHPGQEWLEGVARVSPSHALVACLLAGRRGGEVIT